MLKKQIFLVSAAHSVSDSQLGQPVTEFGRVSGTDMTDLSRTVEEQIAERVAETGAMLQRLEAGEPVASRLWDVTKQWSLDEFHSIYDWLGAHFDVDFFESTVSHESKQMCLDYHKQGLLTELEGGAIGADLGKLGTLVLIKSNGTGLYATKDIALAKRKFEEFGVDRSIYVVDSSQILHFQQVFKTLELVGFEQAARCAHLKYGQVVLPDGKMSSRKGNVVFFSDLKKQLTAEITRDFMYEYTPEGAKQKSAESGKDEPVWPDDEIAMATQRIAVATIRYRMLNNDPIKSVEFDLPKWSAKTGNTGPYLMYTLCRAKSILRKVSNEPTSDRWNICIHIHIHA
jgi:arginyl-tRNA synthetase